MTTAVLVTILASFLWAISYHNDKYLLSGISADNIDRIKVLLFFSTFIAGIVLSPFWLIINRFSVNISTLSFICVFIGSIIYVIATLFYFKAMKENDASIVSAMFQILPVFSYGFAFVLFKESLTIKQIIGSIIILLSAIIISIDINEHNGRRKFKALIFVTFSSLFYSVYYILFDVAIRNSSYSSCSFWLQIVFLVIGIILLCIKSFRMSFINIIKKNGKKYFFVNTVNEGINLTAHLLVNFANTIIPIALANVLCGFQGFFVFLLGVLGTKFLPKYIHEDLRVNVVIQKISCIILGIIGLIILV